MSKILTASLAAFLICAAISTADAVTREDALNASWLMGENAAIGAPDTILSIPEKLGNQALTALPVGTPLRVPGAGFDPQPFGDSYATATGAGPSYLRVGPDVSLDAAGDFTYSLWIRKTGSAEFRKPFQHRTATGFAQVETDNSPGRDGVIWNVRINGTNSETDTTSFMGDGNWHHLALWRKGSLVGVFVDGQVPGVDGFGQEQNLGAGQTLTGTTGFTIGAENNGSNPFLGHIDDFRIYHAALTREEAAMIYNAGRGDFAPSRPFEITEVTRTGNSVSLRFNSVPGRIYSVEASNDMVAWDELEDNLVGEAGSATTGFTEQPVPEDSDIRYYRVRQ